MWRLTAGTSSFQFPIRGSKIRYNTLHQDNIYGFSFPLGVVSYSPIPRNALDALFQFPIRGSKVQREFVLLQGLSFQFPIRGSKTINQQRIAFFAIVSVSH